MEKKEKINLKRLNSVLKKNQIKIIIILLLFALCGYFYSYNFVVPKYKSTSTILLASNSLNRDNNTVTQTDVNLNKTLISTYGKILKSNNVLEKVIENLNLNVTKEDLYKNVQIEEVKDTQIIQIGVVNEDATMAQKIANELNKVFIEEIKQIYKMDNINVVDKASMEVEPYNVNHIRDILVFVLIGIFFSISMISVVYFLDTTIKIEQDVEEFIGVNLIGTIPKNKAKDENEIIVQNNSKSNISEALKTIRTNISFSQTSDNAKTILFTSCNAGEGKSWVASNIAVAYAQSNKNVIIIDADMRKGRQHKIFDVKNINGLAECLKKIETNNDYEILKNYIQETKIPKVHIITIGAIPPNPSELLMTDNMHYLIHMLKCIYDVVIIDGTPCNLVSDSIPISSIADTTILITESRKTKIEDIRNTIKLIKNAGGNIAGIILNKREVKNKEYKKGYYYGEQVSNNKIQLQSSTVEELINNRKEYSKDIAEEKINNEEYIDQLNMISKKIDSLESKMLDIPNVNLEKYTETIESIKKIYEGEIDKNKLAESIKENIIRNELAKKIDDINEETKKIINESKEIQHIDNRKMLGQVIKKIEDQDEKIENLGNKDMLEQVIKKIEDQDKKIEDLDNKETLDKLVQKIESQNEKIKYLDSTKVLNNIVIEMQKINSKYEILQQMQKNNDNTDKIIEIMNELKKVNTRYDKLAEKIKDNLKKQQIEQEREEKQEDREDKVVSKNNVIEMNEFKKKMKKQELIIEYGDEIEYSELLELAVGIYDIGTNENCSYYISNK